MSIVKKKILEMADPGEDIVPKEFDNLILDDVAITKFSPEDKQYLEEFVNMDLLGLNATKLKGLENFPNAPKLIRLELNENFIKGEDLVHLKHLVSVQTLKLANNQINDLKSLEAISCLTELRNLDLIENKVTDEPDYREKVFGMFPELQVLDQLNKEGDEVLSEDDEEDYGEEGEEDMEEEGYNMQNLTEEQKEKLKEQGVDMEKYMLGEDSDLDGEYGEEELSEGGYGDEEGNSPADDDEGEQGGQKRFKAD